MPLISTCRLLWVDLSIQMFLLTGPSSQSFSFSVLLEPGGELLGGELAAHHLEHLVDQDDLSVIKRDAIRDVISA